jgi:hypothetical protein
MTAGRRPGPYRRGDRVRYVFCSDPYTRLRPGDTGTVTYIDDLGTIHIDWDCGSKLGMIPGRDRFERIEGSHDRWTVDEVP